MFRLSPKANSDELSRKSNAFQVTVVAVLRTSVLHSRETKQTHRPGQERS